jgi:endonuclease YncB( thermonuclease family)
MKLIILFCLLLLQTGQLVKVTDGDSVVLLTANKQQIKIRLDGIDCPELGQPYSRKAQQFVRDLCKNRTIKVEEKGKDIYRRTLGVLYADTINVNEELLRAGLAWQYKYNKSNRYKSLEREARKKKINIWSKPEPVAPWEYRKHKKQN